MLAELVLVSTMSFQVTSYRSVPEQTDDSPYYTSINMHVRKGICAVSQDYLRKDGKSPIRYGDVLWIEVQGKPEMSRYCLVADTMNKRIKRGIDFWVATWAEEHAVGVRSGRVYRVTQPKEMSMRVHQEIAYEVYQQALKTGDFAKAYKSVRDQHIKETIELKGQILSKDKLITDLEQHIERINKALKQPKNEL